MTDTAVEFRSDDDHEAVFRLSCSHRDGLDGIGSFDVANEHPRELARVKAKNREYWRYEMERERALKVKRPRQVVEREPVRPSPPKTAAGLGRGAGPGSHPLDAGGQVILRDGAPRLAEGA